MLRRVVLPALALLSGCQGFIGEPSGPLVSVDPPDGSVVVGAPDAGPTVCAPEPTAIPKLLRLSNHEYRSMVSDLVGADVDEALFARWTPVAEVYGFDTMSETRVDQQALEEQLATAEALASIILAEPSVTAHCPPITDVEVPVCTLRPEYSARDDFSDAQARECWSYLDSSGAMMMFDNVRSLWRREPDETAWLWRDGAHPGSTVDVIRRWQAPVTGAARLVGAFTDADPGGGDGVLVSIRHADRVIFMEDLANGAGTTFDVPLTLARGELVDFVIQRKAGPEWDTTAFAATFTFAPTPSKAAWGWANCAEPIARQLASRAFRRPVRTEELADYAAMFDENVRGASAAGMAQPVDEALSAMVQAILLSPSFVFKPELVPGGVDEAERSYAIASRLALFFRGSLPDETLWTLASNGELLDPAVVRAQAERLAASDVDRFATHFAGQWLAYRDLGTHPLAASMRDESRAVFAAVMGEGLGPERLMQPGFTIVDAPLAEYYGLAVPPDQRAPYHLATDERGGLLSHGAFLTRTGGGSEFRRPIHRGLWVLTRLLCRSLPRVDPATREEIAASFGSIDPTLPLPEQMALHRDSSTRCGGCHSHIDPIGLGLEKYDALGHWRDTYASGAPIVTDLELNGVVVRDPHELAAAIGGSDELRACVGTKLLTFALNRGPLDAEQCVGQRLWEGDAQPRSLEEMAVEAMMKGLELTEGM